MITLGLITFMLFMAHDEAPALAVSPKELDFGEAYAGDDPVTELTVTNEGTADLELLGMEFNCGCTLSRILLPSGEEKDIDKKSKIIGVLKPGESAKLEIAFSTRGLLGQLTRRLTIRSNVPGEEHLDLKMRIQIKSPCLAEPRVVDFGDVARAKTVTKKVTLKSAGIGSFDIRGIKNLPPYITFDSRKLDTESCELSFRLKSKAPLGRVQLKPTLEIEAGKVYTMDLFFRANLLSDISFTLLPKDRAGTLDLGRMAKDEGGRGEVLIVNQNASVPYEIASMQILCRQKEYIDARVETLEKGVRYQVILTVKPGVPARFLQGELVILSTHPDEKRRKIRFTGWMQ